MSDGPYNTPASGGGAAYYPPIVWIKSHVDTNASDTIGPIEIGRNNTGATRTIARVLVCNGGYGPGLIANNTNYAAWSVYTYADSVGDALLGSIGTTTTGTGNWSEGGSEEWEVTLSDDQLPDGQAIRIHADKSGSGVITGAYSIVMEFVQPE